jgi:hypothetical protein
MREKLVFVLFLIIASPSFVYGQAENYFVKKAPLSSERFDEFCPVYYKNGLVFCSNRDPNFVNKYSNSQGSSFFKIFYIDTSENKTWQDSRLFSKVLKTKLNDGPVTFSKDYKTVFFSRNIYVEGKSGDISSTRNKLGIFTSEYDGDWKKPKDFRYNNEWYNITSPCISPDGTRLYFASDKTGGYGGSDIYFSTWKNDYWSDPVNLGQLVNTSGNEAYPFMSKDGELYFASDKAGGLGGKDIYYTEYVDSTWLEPVHLNEPINSKYDDFSIITDPVMGSGYFSSNRDGSFDIFSFTTIIPQLFYCEQQRTNQYCYRFEDRRDLEFDPNNMLIEWDFGDSNKSTGQDVEHCFPGPGDYNIEEYVVEKQTGHKIFSKQQFVLEIKEIEQPYISSPDIALPSETVTFDALKSHTPGKNITEYFWDFGDGTNAAGEMVNHNFSSAGEYNIKLGLLLRDKSSGEMSRSSVYKTVKVLNNVAEKESYISFNSTVKMVYPKVSEYDHAFIDNNYQAIPGETNDYVFEVKIFTSKIHLESDDNIFRSINRKYFIKEVYQPESETFRYIVSEDASFIRSYLIFRNLISLGFKDAIIQTRVLSSPEDKEFFNLRMVYGNSADDFFGRLDSRLTSAGFTYFDQIFTLLNKFPETKLVIESHTNRTGNSNANLQLSAQRAQTIVNYLSGRGIDYNRLIPRSYGDSRPLALNNSEDEKRKNQRIDLMLIK